MTIVCIIIQRVLHGNMIAYGEGGRLGFAMIAERILGLAATI